MDAILKKNFTYLFILQNANYIIPLILLPYLTRTLGVENFGKISFVQAFAAYFILLTDYGFNTSSTQEVVRVRENKKELTKVFWSTTITKVLFAVGGFILLVILVMLVPKLYEMRILIFIAFSGVISSILFPVWLFQGLEKMSYITWLNVIPRILVLISIFLFVKLKTDFLLALTLQAGGTLISAIACSILVINSRFVGFYIPGIAEIKSSVREGWHIFASGVATNFYTTTNTVVLGLLANDAAVGIFSASEKIIRSLINLFSSVSLVTFPRINSYFKESKELAFKFGIKVLKYTAFFSSIAGLLLIISAPLIVKILFGVPQYDETTEILRISSFIPFFSLCNGILAVNLLITFGFKRYLFKIVGAGGIFSLLLIVPAVIFFQAKGVAVVATLTEILIMGLLFAVLRKHVRLRVNGER